MPIRVITLKGSARERGRQLGEALREHFLSSFAATQAAKPDNPERVQATIAYMAGECPLLLDEVNGVADALALTPGQVLRTQLYPGWAELENRGGCTEAAAITTDAGPVMFQTGDSSLTPGLMEQLQEDEVLVQQVVPDEGPRWVSVGSSTHPFVLFGLNEEGLARIGQLGQSEKRSAPRKTGLPYLLSDRHVLNAARNVEEATGVLERLVFVGRAKAMILVDASGTMRCMEKWQDRTGRREADANYIYQANDFITPEMSDLADHNQNTKDRHRELGQLFAKAEAEDDLTLDRMWRILKHHASESGSICRHGQPDPVDDGAVSALSMFAKCRDRELYFTWGHTPCEGQYRKLTIDF